jgi:hypothetical protein
LDVKDERGESVGIDAETGDFTAEPGIEIGLIGEEKEEEENNPLERITGDFGGLEELVTRRTVEFDSGREPNDGRMVLEGRLGAVEEEEAGGEEKLVDEDNEEEANGRDERFNADGAVELNLEIDDNGP